MFHKRDLLKGALAAGLGGLTASWVRAASPLTLFIPSGPSGGWYQTGRVIEHALRAGGLASDIQLEYAPGAGGTIGLTRFLQRVGQADLLMIAGVTLIGSLLVTHTQAKFTDTAPIARLTGEPLVLTVPVSSPFRTLDGLLQAFRADPTRIVFSGGILGGTDHILAGMIAKAVGVPSKQLTYLGFAPGGALAALVGNQASCATVSLGDVFDAIKAGRLRPLALSADRRMPGLAAPTFREAGLDIELYNWRGVFAPPGLPPFQRSNLADLMASAVVTPTWASDLAANGWSDIFLPGEPFVRFVAAEVERVGGVLKDLGLV